MERRNIMGLEKIKIFFIYTQKKARARRMMTPFGAHAPDMPER